MERPLALLASAGRTLQSRAMHVRTRKLVGTVALLVLIAAYSLAAMAVGAAYLDGASGLGQFLFYALAGLGWLLPALPLVRWMQRP